LTDKKTIINKKQEWIFTNSKDLNTLGKTKVRSGLILVQNKFDENLGLGMVQKRGIKNLLDVGDYLRRERKNQ
jgi:ribosome biogenesis protein Nip4